MRTRTVQFPRFPAGQAQRTAAPGGPAWGWWCVVSLTGSLACLLGGALYGNVQQGAEAPLGMAALLIGAGAALSIVSTVCLIAWFRRVLRTSRRPWGRLMLAGLLGAWILNVIAQQQHAQVLATVLGQVEGVLVIGIVVRVFTRGRGRSAQDEAARWAAGALGENIVSQALAQLDTDHVIINNLPIAGRGDADHVVVGPAGVVVIETKYLAGRISCMGHGRWRQAKRDEVREIADPAAQVQRAAAALAARLRRSGLWNVPVHSVLVLAHPRAELDVQRSSVPVVRPFELVPLLRRLAREQPRLDGNMVTATANALLNGHGSCVEVQTTPEDARISTGGSR